MVAIADSGCITLRIPRPRDTASPGIRAKITLPCSACTSRDFPIHVVFTNVSHAKATLNGFCLPASVLMLDVFDSSGKILPPYPPPVPPPDIESYDIVLAPGEHREVTYQLAIGSSLLPNGKYAIRTRAIDSNTVVFTLEGLPD
jgi:hypothetical protein